YMDHAPVILVFGDFYAAQETFPYRVIGPSARFQYAVSVVPFLVHNLHSMRTGVIEFHRWQWLVPISHLSVRLLVCKHKREDVTGRIHSSLYLGVLHFF